MLAKDLRLSQKMVVGSCVSLGVMVEDRPAKRKLSIDAVIYDKEIKAGLTIIVSADKNYDSPKRSPLSRAGGQSYSRRGRQLLQKRSFSTAVVAAATPAVLLHLAAAGCCDACRNC